MRYGKSEHHSYGLENLQEERERATDPVAIKQIQMSIDHCFFGEDTRKKSRKERRKERKKEKQRMREEEY